MSLPFLKDFKSTGVIVHKRKADAPGGQAESESPEENHALEACAVDLVRAIHAKDTKAVMEALKATFEVLNDNPEAQEESSSDSNTFDAQNAKAAQENR